MTFNPIHLIGNAFFTNMLAYIYRVNKCLALSKRESVCVCVCVCERERERERETEIETSSPSGTIPSTILRKLRLREQNHFSKVACSGINKTN